MANYAGSKLTVNCYGKHLSINNLQIIDLFLARMSLFILMRQKFSASDLDETQFLHKIISKLKTCKEVTLSYSTDNKLCAIYSVRWIPEKRTKFPPLTRSTEKYNFWQSKC